jgi:thiol-disulfide isomerase/thioredoxin
MKNWYQSAYVYFVLILGVFVFVVAGCENSDIDKTRNAHSEPVDTILHKQPEQHLGQAPDFEKISLKKEVLKLSDYKGKIVVLNFWATWCGPCRREIPLLIKLQDEYSDRLVVIGVALDEEGFEVVGPYAEEMQINYPVVWDDYSYGKELGGIYMVPTTFIINQKGAITARKIGELSGEDIRPRIEHLLALP